MASELEAALECLGPHDHLCSIYENEQDHFAVAIPFIRIGLTRNEKCVYITDTPSMEGVRRAMHAGAIDIERAVQSGALTLATKDQTYLRNGAFDPEWMFTYWREAAAQAEREGFSSLRATGETEWVVRGGPGMERWMEYESRLTHALAESNAFALCQYNRRLHPAALLLDVIRTHPIIIYRDTVCRNFYFVPPDEFLGEQSGEREVERLLNNVRDREKLDAELRRVHAGLEQRVLDRTRELRESESRVRHHNSVLEGINRILSEALSSATEEDLGRACLDVAQEVTRSKLGFIGELNANGEIDDVAISDPGWAACSMPRAGPNLKLPGGFKVHGIYGRVVLDGRSFFTNSPETHPDRIGLPEGHPPLTAFLGVPLIHSGKTIGMIAVANAAGGYTQQDLDALESLALPIVQVFLRKRAECAVRAGEERLRQAQKMESIGVLAGGIAHDFNNLLVGVVGNASLVEEMIPPDHEAQPLLRRLIKSGEQAAFLTRQLLAYAGKGQFIVEPVDLSSVVDETGDLLEGSLPKKIALRFQLRTRLPRIEMDRSQMQQIAMNLVVNAVEAIGENSGQITVSTGEAEITDSDARIPFAHWSIQPGPCVFLEVRDDGCGMDDATQAHIFEPFFSTKSQGRGLGLSAVAGIVRALNGAIRVESSPGAGTSFTVLLPAARAGGAAPPPAAPDEARRTGSVLFVDDEETVREMAKIALQKHGCEVLIAASGAQAVEILERDPNAIDLVVLDLGMPGMSGEETLPRLRAIRPDLAVVVSSGHSERHALSGFQGAVLSGFIQKPYTSQALAGAVKRVLARVEKQPGDAPGQQRGART